jgi:hypothetical protein
VFPAKQLQKQCGGTRIGCGKYCKCDGEEGLAKAAAGTAAITCSKGDSALANAAMKKKKAAITQAIK